MNGGLVEVIIAILNTVSLAVYFILLAAGLRPMVRRARWFWDIVEPPLRGLQLRRRWRALPILNRRALGLYAGLALFGGLVLLVRVTGTMFHPDSIERLVFVIITTFALLGPIFYYTRSEYNLDNPGVK